METVYEVLEFCSVDMLQFIHCGYPCLYYSSQKTNEGFSIYLGYIFSLKGTFKTLVKSSKDCNSSSTMAVIYLCDGNGVLCRSS